MSISRLCSRTMIKMQPFITNERICSSTNDYVIVVESIFDIINVFGFGHQKMICYCGFTRFRYNEELILDNLKHIDIFM